MTSPAQLSIAEALEDPRDQIKRGLRDCRVGVQGLDAVLAGVEELLDELLAPRDLHLPDRVNTAEAARLTGLSRRTLLRRTCGCSFRRDHTRKTKTFDRAGLLLWDRTQPRRLRDRGVAG